MALVQLAAASSAYKAWRRGSEAGASPARAQRPRAAALDASAALALNPDSARAYKLRGRARRVAGDYEGAAQDLGQAQRIDFDGEVVAELKYCSARGAKIRATTLHEAHNAKLDAAAGGADKAP